MTRDSGTPRPNVASDVRLADRLAHRLRLQPLEHRRERQARARRTGTTMWLEQALRRCWTSCRRPAASRFCAAAKTRNSDVRSGGIDSSTSDAARIARGHDAVAPRAGDDAERQADERGERRAPSARGCRCCSARSGMRSATGRSYCSERPKSRCSAPTSQSRYCAPNDRFRP